MKRTLIIAVLLSSTLSFAGATRQVASHVAKPAGKASWSITKKVGHGLKKAGLAVGAAVGYVAYQAARAAY